MSILLGANGGGGDGVPYDPSLSFPTNSSFLTKFDDQGRLTVTGIKEEDTRYVSDKPIEVTPNSIFVGKNVTIGDTGSFLSAYGQAFLERKLFTESIFSSTSEQLSNYNFGEGNRSRRVFMYPERTQFNFPLDVQTNSGNIVQFLYATETNLLVRTVNLKLNAQATNVRFVVERLVDVAALSMETPDAVGGSIAFMQATQNFAPEWRTVWESHNEIQFANGEGYTLTPDGNNDVSIDVSDDIQTAVNFGIEPVEGVPQIFRATLETSEAELPLLGATFDIGLGTQFYPWLALGAQDWKYVDNPDWFDTRPDGTGTFSRNARIHTERGLEVAKKSVNETDATAEQPLFDTPIDGNEFGIEWVHQDPDATLESVTFKITNSINGVQFQLGSDEDDEFKDIFIEQDVVAGDVIVDFSAAEVVLKNGVTYRIDVYPPDQVNDQVNTLKGAVTQPFFTMRIKELEITEVLAGVNLYDDFVHFGVRRGGIPANWVSIGSFIVPSDKEPDEFIGSFGKTTGFSRTVNFRLRDGATNDIYFDGSITTNSTGLIAVSCTANVPFPASGDVGVVAEVDRNGVGFGIQDPSAQMLLKNR